MSDPREYEALRREEKNHSRWFMVGLAGFSASTIFAVASRGSTAGWNWLLGVLLFSAALRSLALFRD